MKKSWFIVFSHAVLISCGSLQMQSVNNKTFKSQSYHMVGTTRIQFFNDSLFLLQERDGMMYSKGFWKISDNGKSILLSSFDKTSSTGSTGDTAIYFRLINERLEVDGRHKLLYKKVVLKEQK